MFDRLTYVDTLKSAGIPEEQARAHASALQSALTDSVATKDDIATLRTEMTGIRSDLEKLRTDVVKMEASIRVDMDKLDTSLRSEMETKTNADRREANIHLEFAGLRTEIASQKSEILRWMFGMMIAFSGIIITAFKLIR